MMKHETQKLIRFQSIKARDKRASFALNCVFLMICVLFVVPFLLIISISFTPESAIYQHGFTIIPRGFTTLAYQMVFKSAKTIMNAYMISVSVTFVGTLLGVFVSTMLAYALSRKDFAYKNVISFIVFFTMLFNGGLIPWYLVVTKVLRIHNTILALILPYTVIPMFVLFLKGFLSNLPHDIFEAAKIDGAKEFRIFFKIVVPLSKPGIATVSLLYALLFWNDWWLALVFIDNKNLIPLQVLIYKIMGNTEFLLKNAGKLAGLGVNLRDIPSESLKMATMLVTAGPMLFVFPFFQRYFVKGLTVGSVKG